MKEASGRNTLLNITLGTFLAVLLGWLLYLGQNLLIPIVIALLFAYLLFAVDELMGRAPVVRHLPLWLRRVVLVLAAIAVLSALAALITVTVQELVARAPHYQVNLERLIGEVARMVGFERVPDWETIRQQVVGRINIQAWLTSAAGQIGSIGGVLFLIIIYIAFLLSERDEFVEKLDAAFPEPEKARRIKQVIGAINERVGQYLATKTLVNALLGLASYVIMLAFGLDNAAFWALVIALLNYIPYIGSIIALILPVALSIVQFGSWPMTIGLYACLQVLQLIVGNFLEPAMVGRKVNQSAFVVLVALSFWSAIWGITGAILAVPLTSILMIIFNEIPATRPLAVLMSERVRHTSKSRKGRADGVGEADGGAG
ncbi:AI-2E family transporter [Tessaracoccus sp. OH4464_COT-324]|uniref:AI-2E family transporter n=1 Tax=Tessaracoccus sp. OH4464_COT-324 TaxID=2491059 RepID=UPI000F643595|nr:AI-2E family transporter [Tessaracoccus sp. OH4464_COT-324]RRD46179.1 AI-2E family transporter [Tessaracoccus sp. OH4464_COT-324]